MKDFAWWESQVFIFWVAPLTMSTLIQKLAVFIFWPLEHAHVIGHVLSVRHAAVTQYMWHVTCLHCWDFSISFFLLRGIWGNRYEWYEGEAKPTLVSQTTFVTLLPCIIHDVCHVMCTVERDATPHPRLPRDRAGSRSLMMKCRVHSDGDMTTACVMAIAEESSIFYNALTASDF